MPVPTDAPCVSKNVRSSSGAGNVVVTSRRRGQTVVLDDAFETVDGYVWDTYTGRSGRCCRSAVAESRDKDYLASTSQDYAISRLDAGGLGQAT